MQLCSKHHNERMDLIKSKRVLCILCEIEEQLRVEIDQIKAEVQGLKEAVDYWKTLAEIR